MTPLRIQGREALRCAALVAFLLSTPAAEAREEFSVSAGLGYSAFSAESVFGELQLVGGAFDVRAALPYSMYAQLQLRSEDGEGTALDEVSKNDYLRVLVEGGFEFPLILGFVGNIGANYVQSDIDVGARLGDQEFTVGVNREGFGGRVGLARDFGGWFRLRGEMEYSPVEEAIGAVFDLETARSGPWALAIQYSGYPFLRQAALMLRYRFLSPDPAPPRRQSVGASDVPRHLETTTLGLALAPELAAPPMFSPPPGCQPSAFETLSPRCDPPGAAYRDGPLEWLAVDEAGDARPGCAPDPFEVRPPHCDAPFVPEVPGQPEWHDDPGVPD